MHQGVVLAEVLTGERVQPASHANELSPGGPTNRLGAGMPCSSKPRRRTGPPSWRGHERLIRRNQMSACFDYVQTLWIDGPGLQTRASNISDRCNRQPVYPFPCLSTRHANGSRSVPSMARSTTR